MKVFTTNFPLSFFFFLTQVQIFSSTFCFLKIAGTEKKRRRRKQPLDGLQQRRYWKLKEEALDRRPELYWYVPVPCGYNRISHHTAEDYTAFCKANMVINIDRAVNTLELATACRILRLFRTSAEREPIDHCVS
jgi:hypothetical protein